MSSSILPHILISICKPNKHVSQTCLRTEKNVDPISVVVRSQWSFSQTSTQQLWTGLPQGAFPSGLEQQILRKLNQKLITVVKEQGKEFFSTINITRTTVLRISLPIPLSMMEKSIRPASIFSSASKSARSSLLLQSTPPTPELSLVSRPLPRHCGVHSPVLSQAEWRSVTSTSFSARSAVWLEEGQCREGMAYMMLTMLV